MKKLLSALLVMGAFMAPSIAQSAHPGSGTLASGPYTVSGSITTPSPCIVASGREVLFAATTEIVLTPGFEARAGSNFRSVIGNYPSLTTESDNDKDLLADWWELLYFGTLNLNGSNDYDADGVSNYFEFTQNSDPSNISDKPPAGMYYQYDALGRILQILRLK